MIRGQVLEVPEGLAPCAAGRLARPAASWRRRAPADGSARSVADGGIYRSTTKAILQCTLYRERLPFSSTSALLPITSTPRIPRTVCAAACTALRTASLKEFGELPTISLIRTTAPGTWSCFSDMSPPDVTSATPRRRYVRNCSAPEHLKPP